MIKHSYLILVLMALVSFSAVAQEPLEVFGYIQPYFNKYTSKYGDPGPPEGEDDMDYNTMGVAQMNLFFKKNFGDDFTAFVNFEIVNNYSSDRGFGSFNLQEAYIAWNYSDYLKMKFGMAIPKFNQLYEIYNRTPLLPYIFRPKLYETNQGNLVDIFEYLPQKSLVHLTGIAPIGPIKLDYAAYLNYPTNGFFASKENDLIPGYVAFGQSAVNYLGFGGRVGLRNEYFNLGASIGTDKENRRDYRASVVKKYSAYLDDETIARYTSDTISIGDLDRLRIGFDFSVSYAGFTLAGEYLKLTSDIPSDMKAELASWNEEDPYFVGKGFDKNFYYAMLQYNISDKLYAFAMYDYMDDQADPFFFGVEGYGGYGFGAGYSINDYIVVKAQYNRNKAVFDVQELDLNNDGEVKKGEDLRDFFDNWFVLGASISF